MGRYGCLNWIGDMFKDSTFTCPDESEWKFDKKISEKSIRFHDERDVALAEAQAVYHCHQVKGQSVGKEAIIKVRVQVPHIYPANSDPNIRAREAVTECIPGPTATEILTLTHLNKKGCSVVPQLLYRANHYQSIEMPIPMGYVVILIMQKCPGAPLTDFWRYNEAKREKIREAFRRDYTNFLSYNAYAEDPRKENIIYDEQENKCWFIDHEQTDILDGPESLSFYEGDFVRWGLRPYIPGGNCYRCSSPKVSEILNESIKVPEILNGTFLKDINIHSV
ncbi:hypothetical protein MauCBS54593_004099 [Microsporum audouinii]